jgi:hypothetical protein
MNERNLCHEVGIVWEEDIDRLDYVRATVMEAVKTRQKPIPWPGPGRRVGYSILAKDAPRNHYGYFTRRIFWLKDYDRDSRPMGDYRQGVPHEGVDPRTVQPGIWGEKTPRARGQGSEDDEQGSCAS